MMYLIKTFSLLLAALILSACSMQGMAEKMVPANVLADHNAQIDALLNEDLSRLESAFAGALDFETPETIAQMDQILAAVPGGAEVRRDYVGVESSAAISAANGKTRDIGLMTEVQTEDGFMLVSAQYGLAQDGSCCRLLGLNVKRHDSSPIRAGLASAAKVGKFIGLGFLLLIGVLVFWLVRRQRKLRRAR